MQTFKALRLPPDNILFPNRLEIDALNVTYCKGNIFGYRKTVVDRNNIVSVSIRRMIFWGDVIIETKGGRRIEASSFKLSDARAIVNLLSNNATMKIFGAKTMNVAKNVSNYYSGYDVNTFLAIPNLQHKITEASVDMDLLDAAVFWFTNVERRRHNLKQFQFHDKLRQSAMLHSEQMKIHNFFSHDNDFDARYKTLTDRIDLQKDNIFQGFMSWGENIADSPVIEANKRFTVENRNGVQRFFSLFGTEILPYSYYNFAKNVVVGWMNSPGHRANILKPDFVYLGCGCAEYEKQGNGYSMLYFKLTQNFGGALNE